MEISRLELEFEESLPRKTTSIFKEGIGHESNGAANHKKQIFLLCQISPSASSTRDLGTRLAPTLFVCSCNFDQDVNWDVDQVSINTQPSNMIQQCKA